MIRFVGATPAGDLGAARRLRMARAAGDIALDLFVPMATPVAAFEQMSVLIVEAIKSQRLQVAGQFPTSFAKDSIFETLAPFTSTVSPDATTAGGPDAVALSGNSIVTYGIIIAIVFLTIILVVGVVVMVKKYSNRDTKSFYFRGMDGGSTLKDGSGLIFRPAFDAPGYLQIGGNDGGGEGGGGRHPLSMYSGHMSTATSPYMDAVPQVAVQKNAAIEVLANQISTWDTPSGGDRTDDTASSALGDGSRRPPTAPPSSARPVLAESSTGMPLEAPTFHYYPPNSN